MTVSELFDLMAYAFTTAMLVGLVWIFVSELRRPRIPAKAGEDNSEPISLNRERISRRGSDTHPTKEVS
jgi:hypothetical protein